MCNLYLEGNRAIIDLSKCPYEFASPEFLNLHLKDLATQEVRIKTIRYEEEIVIELTEEKTAVLMEYANIVSQIENLLLREDIYGMREDPGYSKRREALRKFYEYVFMNPAMAEKVLSGYDEPKPEKQIFEKGFNTFKAWSNGILKRFKESKLYLLVAKTGDFRAAFLSLIGLRSLYFTTSVVLDVPENAVPLKEAGASYELPYGVKVQIYEIPGAEAYMYVQTNPIIEGLNADLKKLLKRVITEQMHESFDIANYEILMDVKTREYRQYFLDESVLKGYKITPKEALVMGREAAAWVVGLGSGMENLALDKDKLTDIYIDGENSPLYLEHAKYGLCHTLIRYNHELLERAFKNIVFTQGGLRKFDESSPIIDVMMKRLNMRCHLQRPPATFEELQGALRIMKVEPYTYPKYISLSSISPFGAGYDDVLVGLGCSEAVLGLKGVGKTAFTALKIAAIGTARRIIPIQDIEEIPVKAYRKRGFHIGAARVQSSDREDVRTKELDLVSMANALLRMGDAALIINEVRSRIAVQGIINLLNTQPGIFLLYNLHAESLRDVQDRLELVFGIPAASMLATDRYSFLRKLRFGRRGRIYRVLGNCYETDTEQKKFIEVFRFRRGDSIGKCMFECKFLRNPEANATSLSKLDLGKMEKELDIAFIPPALARRSEETGISPEQYLLQAFFKGKLYDHIRNASKQLDNPLLMDLDFVLRANTSAVKLLSSLEKENGQVDFRTAWTEWEGQFKQLLKEEALADLPPERQEPEDKLVKAKQKKR